MLKQVLFRDRQEVQALDFVNHAAFAVSTFDAYMADAVQSTIAWVDFVAQATGPAELTVSTGRLYNAGAGYVAEAPTVFNVLPELPALNGRYAAIVGYGSAVDTDTQPRDFLIDTETGATEPAAVPMQRLRKANIALVYGVEAPQPLKPSVGAGNVVIAWALLSPAGISSVAMVDENRLSQVFRERMRVNALEVWRGIVGPRIDTLISDIAAIKAMLAQMGQSNVIDQLAIDVARVKEALEIDESHTDYDADRFLDTNESDTGNVNFLAKVEEGVRFSPDAANEVALTVFNPVNPDVRIVNGFLLPKYSEVKRFEVGPFFEALSISQYTYQSWEMVQKSIARTRIRYGESKTVCTNSSWWRSGNYDSSTGIFKKAGETWEFESKSGKRVRLRQFWYDTWTDYYWDRQTTDLDIAGQQIAQTFLNSADGWLTSIGLKFTAKGADGNVHISLAEVVHGEPNLEAILNTVTLDVEDILTSADASVETKVQFPATFLEAGKRYAIVIVTGGNHFVGMAQGTQYAQGTFFVSVDGAYQMGTANKDLMFALHFARFDKTRTVVELTPMSLSGGITDIDILAPLLTPASCDLTFEVNVAGVWHPLAEVASGSTPLYGLPPLLPFRATFTGTSDVQPGLNLVQSRLRYERPRTTFKHISTLYTLAAPSDSFKVIAIIENYKEANHNFDIKLLLGGTGSEVAAATVVDVELDPPADARTVDHKRIKRTFIWTDVEITTPMSTVKIVANGATSSALDTFHLGERIHLAY